MFKSQTEKRTEEKKHIVEERKGSRDLVAQQLMKKKDYLRQEKIPKSFQERLFRAGWGGAGDSRGKVCCKKKGKGIRKSLVFVESLQATTPLAVG